MIPLTFLEIMTVVTVNRVQDVCANPIYGEIDLATLDGLFLSNRRLDLAAYRAKAPSFNSVHVGDFILEAQ